MGVTEDLMAKISDDVQDAMLRTLSLSDERLAVAISGGGVAIGVVGAMLDAKNGVNNPTSDPSPDCILLAALICGRIGSGHSDPMNQAYKDLEILKKVRRPVNRTKDW